MSDILEIWLDEPTVIEVEVGLGIPVEGIQGPPGTSGDANFTFSPIGPQATWVIVHGLNKYPSVTTFDSAGSEIKGAVHYDSLNQVTVSFAGGFSGTATLN